MRSPRVTAVAIGAALASNCVPCIEYHIPKARSAGITDAEIEEAIAIAHTVRKVPTRKVLQTARALVGQEEENASETAEVAGGCAVCDAA